MPRKKKKEEIIEITEEVDSHAEEQIVMLQQAEDISPVALTWETHTRFIDVTIEDIIAGARDLLEFVYEDYEE